MIYNELQTKIAALMPVSFPDDDEHLESDNGKLLDEEIIEQVAINTPVVMDEDIPNADDAMPVNRGESMLQLTRQTLDAFTDDDDAADDGIFLRRIFPECLLIHPLHVVTNHIDAVNDELQEITCFCIHSIGV